MKFTIRNSVLLILLCRFNGQCYAASDAAVPDQTGAPGTISAPDPKNRHAQDEGIQTVVVTAQKRKEEVGKVPVSLSVIGGEELMAQHIKDYADVTRAVPNISFSGGGGGGDAGNGPGLSNIEIRGVSSSAGSATVGVYMDDVSMNVANLYSMGSAEPKFFDLDHVEVLRGPQGTLYGSSSMGGTIRFITNQPDLKQRSTDIYTETAFRKSGQTSYEGSVVLNQPLIRDELALRLGVQSGHQAGYISQVDQNGRVQNSGINWQDAGVVHFAMKWAPDNRLTVTPNVFYQKVKTGDTDVSYSQVLDNGQPLTPAVPLPPYQTSKIMREPGSDQLLVPSLTVNYSADMGDITSITSVFRRTFTRVQDGGQADSYQLGCQSCSSPVIVNPALGAAITQLPSAVTLDNRIAQFSEEIRYASKPYEPGLSPLTWIVGAYVANEHTEIVEGDYIFGINQAFGLRNISPLDQSQFTDGWNATGFPNDNTFAGSYRYHDTQQSVFGEASYYFDPTLHVTAGLRYLRAQETFSSQQSLFYYGSLTGPDLSSESSATKTTPKLSVIWEIDPQNSLYATAQEGFRVGGANSGIPNSCFTPGAPGVSEIAPFTPDSLWSGEIGDKAKFFSNRLTVNSSLYYLKWTNMQQEIQLGCAYSYNVNVGSATSYGMELEVKARPVSSLLIELAAGYSHATLDNSNGAQTGLVGAVAGAKVPGVPSYNIALTSTWHANLTEDYAGFVRGAARWTGPSTGGFNQLPSFDAGAVTIPPNINSGVPNPDFLRPAYHTLDLSTGISWGEWEATLFVKNLLNNDMVLQRPITQTIAGEVYRMEPRQIGVSLSARF